MKQSELRHEERAGADQGMDIFFEFVIRFCMRAPLLARLPVSAPCRATKRRACFMVSERGAAAASCRLTLMMIGLLPAQRRTSHCRLAFQLYVPHNCFNFN